MLGDGLDDLIVGVNDDSNKEGKAYVVFGKQDGTAIDLSAIAAGIGVHWRLSRHYNYSLLRH
jgi:hypothetical protein